MSDYVSLILNDKCIIDAEHIPAAMIAIVNSVKSALTYNYDPLKVLKNYNILALKLSDNSIQLLDVVTDYPGDEFDILQVVARFLRNGATIEISYNEEPPTFIHNNNGIVEIRSFQNIAVDTKVFNFIDSGGLSELIEIIIKSNNAEMKTLLEAYRITTGNTTPIVDFLIKDNLSSD